MTAMSPGSRRRTRTLVLGSTLATPTMPGGASALPRLTCANLEVTLIAFHSSRHAGATAHRQLKDHVVLWRPGIPGCPFVTGFAAGPLPASRARGCPHTVGG